MSDNPEDYELFHHGIKGMKWGVRRPDRDGDGRVDKSGGGKKSSGVKGKNGSHREGRSLTTQATLNKATIERQQAKEHLDETRENMKNPVNRKAAAIAGGVTGAGIGAIGGGVGGAVAGAAAGTYIALKATSDKGRQAYLKNAESKYEAAVEREKRIKDGTRSKIEKLVDWGDVTAVDLYTAKNYKVKDD